MTSKDSRVHNLDLLRAIAILMVLIHHLVASFPGSPAAIKTWAPLGAYGVDLFFVISGWLIGGLFLKEYRATGKVALMRFWIRRWMRTLPPYYCALIVSWILVYYHHREPFDWGFLFFIQNYYDKLPFFLVSWSLCVEEHFYLVMPVFMLVVLKLAPKFIPMACLLLLAFTNFCRWIIDLPPNESWGYVFTATHLRLDGLILGVLSATIYYSWNAVWDAACGYFKWLWLVFLPVVLLLYATKSSSLFTFGPLAAAIGFCSLIWWARSSSSIGIANWSITRAIALSSYSLYLIHIPAIRLSNSLWRMINGPDWLWPIMAIISIAAAGQLFYLWVEKTSIAIRDRYVPGTKAPRPDFLNAGTA